MAEFTHRELRQAREARKMPRWKLAQEINVSEDTLERWETGKQEPHADDIGRIEHALCAESELIWHRWMMSNCESYRERHSSAQPTGLLNSVIGIRFSMQDALAVQEKAERDVMDGTFDDPTLRAECRSKWEQVQARITEVLAQIPKD